MLKLYEDDLFKERIKELCIRFDISLFILFGSRARDEEKKTSDYDFAFYPQRKISAEEYIELHDKLMGIVKNEKVDLIDLKKTKKLHVINNIFQTGIVIYEQRKGLFKHLKWSAWMDYQDFKHYYFKEKEITRKKLKNMLTNG